MADAPDAKRRKFHREVVMDSPSASGLAHVAWVSPITRSVIWPKGKVPVEIFNIIAGYLPRIAIQRMRLVSHEFDYKLSSYYFHNVVAKFHPDMYGYLDDNCDRVTGGAKGLPTKGLSVIKNGLRVFNDFGVHIRAFALSLELNEADLADPPVKLSQEVVKASWGLYRWPLEKYARYADLEDLEDTADETTLMAHAFSKLIELKELGLSCDPGLGFLVGPHLQRPLPEVFTSSRYEPDMVGEPEEAGTCATSSVLGRYGNLKRMVKKAGYSEEEAHDAIKLLLECEGKSLKWAERSGEVDDEPDDDRRGNNQPGSRAGSVNPPRSLPVLGRPPPLPVNLNNMYMENRDGGLPPRKKGLSPKHLTLAQKEMLLEMSWAHDALIQSYVLSVIDNCHTFANVTVFSVARIPSSLLHNLKRKDLWDALAGLNEFRLGVIPDWRRLSKKNYSGIEDTRISPMLAYESVFNLLQDFVGVRDNIKLLHFEWICGGETGYGLAQRNRYILPAPFIHNSEHMVSPIAALGRHEDPQPLLSLPHIRKLSLRNCWVTPHIFMRVVRDMISNSLADLELDSVSMTGPPTLQDQDPIMPRNTDMSHWPWPLCNGATPGRTFVHRNAQQAVQALQLGLGFNQLLPNPPFPIVGGQGGAGWWHAPQATAHPPPAILLPPQPAATLSALNLQTGQPLAPPAAGLIQNAAPAPQLNTTWAGPLGGISPVPGFLSWAHILNELTPLMTIQEKLPSAATAHEDRLAELAEKLESFIGKTNRGLTLKSIQFRSCGYALIDYATIENAAVLPSHPVMVNMASDTLNKLIEHDKTMLSDDSVDRRFGKIVDYIEESEMNLLYHVFNMTIPGFDNPYGAADVDPAMYRDGFILHGIGRFHGELRLRD